MSEEDSNLIPKLYQRLSVDDIDNIRKYFRELQSDGLSYEDFRDFLLRYNIQYRDSDFNNLCRKIDMDRDSRIKFREFITYFIAEYQHDDKAAEKFAIIPPIARPAKVLPSAVENQILRVFYIPPSKDYNFSSLSASYISIGCFGDTAVWSADWKLKRTMYFDKLIETRREMVEQFDNVNARRDSKILILDAILLLDLNFMCISSSSNDLRFFDVSNASYGTLRLYIRSFPMPLSAFYYHSYHDDESTFSGRLIFGDFVGSVRVIDFTKNFAKHIRSGTMIRQFSYEDLMEGKVETMRFHELFEIHSDIIRQVFYFARKNAIISASESVQTESLYLPGVIITHLGDEKHQTVFKMHSGTTCFAFDDISRTLATGGPDRFLRLWDPKNSEEPTAILSGHLAGIANIFIQDSLRVYSIDKFHTIKVWDIEDQILLQTFAGFKPIFPQDTEIITFYNNAKRELIAAAMDIAIIKCNPRIQADKSDGITHMTPVTLILLNELFHFLVSCGSDSTIIVWDIWNGRKVNWILRAHTALHLGRSHTVEICAGCFDTKHQFLLTGAVNGSIKIWNLNDFVCVRSLNVNSSIIGVFWRSEQIFVVDRHVVTEFNDNNDYKQQINRGKIWNCLHFGEIVCTSASREQRAIVTSCSHGDLIFWNYDTGTPYMRFNLSHPQRRMKIVYRKNFKKTSDEIETPVGVAFENDDDDDDVEYVQGSSNNQNNVKSPIIAHCMLSLNNRVLDLSNGTLFVSLSNGKIQVWSHHHYSQNYIVDFNAIHITGDVITAMTTDTENCYLFTGSLKGYIKAWMIADFCVSASSKVVVSRVKFRARFPFVWRDDFEGRAKRAVRDQQQPWLLNSYQAHKGALISGLIYSEKNQILISSSEDKSVRLWDLSGKYINTIGGHVNWEMLSPNEPLPPEFSYKIPADLKSVVSYTTLKVLQGGNIPTLVTREADEMLKTELEDVEKYLEDERNADSDVESSDKQLLNKILSRPDVKPKDDQEKKTPYEKPFLDSSLSHIPIYRHLRIHRTVPINLPSSMPSCLDINDLPNLQNISQLEPEESK